MYKFLAKYFQEKAYRCQETYGRQRQPLLRLTIIQQHTNVQQERFLKVAVVEKDHERNL